MRDRPDAIVVPDDLAARRAGAVRHALDRAGPRHRFPPPCSALAATTARDARGRSRLRGYPAPD